MKISEIFCSVNGEVGNFRQGELATFIRLHGCNLDCDYCDTPQKDFIEMSLDQIFHEVMGIGCVNVLITGGEPLLQKGAVVGLVDILLRYNFEISIETNGTISIENFSRKVNFIIDYKLDCANQMIQENFYHMEGNDWVKILIYDQFSYEEAKKAHRMIRKINEDVGISFGLIKGKSSLSYRILVDRLIEDKLWDVRVNTQIHKWMGVQ